MNPGGLFDLAGRHAVVTGAARGLGLGIARALSAAGARVAGVDRLPMPAVQAGEEPAVAHAIQADLADRQELQRAAEAARQALDGRVDILVNNAGLQIRGEALDFPVADWDAVLALNLTAAFLLSQAFARGMAVRGRGKIINLASIRSSIGSHQAVAYGVSKGGIAQLTRSLSNDLAPLGIQVNAIAPGFMETAMTSAIRADADGQGGILARIPAGRWGVAEDLAGLAVFLAADASNYVTGAIIPCDGGFLAA
ncbi:SDR family oxidoreductase [Pseudothauera nasutitermitis]|uniref:SDR family oxidoreductase n=1 Tax=Pseudothauera nasutitermitis TaxID=2565930 RepID=A0A4S4B6K0_9RHOO|nr:SDR family oxidoreductase [Pseudothauera nasutitermitis]THF66587.1 SDR family oxidoreductase [Pseudothauera nasutitermitis]